MGIEPGPEFQLRETPSRFGTFMKIIFAQTQDDELQLITLCETEQIPHGMVLWREKYGEDSDFYSIDCPDWQLTQADVDDEGEAATRKATEIIINTLQRINAGDEVAELEALGGPRTEATFSGTAIAERPADPDIRPVTFVIWRHETNEFMAGALEEDGPPAWLTSPVDAVAYESQDEAETVAAALVAALRIVLTVCALHETANHYWKEPLREFFPLDSTPSIN